MAWSASLSPEAQAVLGMGRFEEAEYPALDDLDAWRAMIEARYAQVLAMVEPRAALVEAGVVDTDLDGVTTFLIAPHGAREGDRRVLPEVQVAPGIRARARAVHLRFQAS